MSSESVHPLRIAKGTPNSSPDKMASPQPRPLSELSPMERRRNSPSWNQASPSKKSVLSNESSPFQSSPLDSVSSPRLFWQNRNSENILYGGRNGSPSPTRRSSIERLQKASRVRNSNILALEQKQEYDPTRIPQIERPLAKVQDGVFGFPTASGSLRSPDEKRSYDPFRSERKSAASMMAFNKSPSSEPAGPAARTHSKDQASPTKSSLSPSKFKSSFDHDTGIWSPDTSVLEERELPNGRSLHRHVKSVTFDAAPPQINEYEMATPDLSSIGTNSREGSYESMDEDEDDDEDISYDPAHMDAHEDDSFDASLEDTDKTPVVGPDEWARESPLIHRGGEPEAYDGSPMPEHTPSLAILGRHSMNNQRVDSSNGAGDHRPLPPLPGLHHARSQSAGSAPASPGLSATAERMLGSHRSLPAPPPASATKSDIQSFINGKMSLEERLKLMMLSDDNGGKSAAEQQRERRLRRSSGRDRSLGSRSSLSRENTPSMLEAQEEDDNVGDISGLGDYELPSRISRESIMRRVKGNRDLDVDADYIFSSPVASPERHLPLDPDVPIPSTEDSMVDEMQDGEESSVIITRLPDDDEDDDEYDEDDDVLDLYDDLDHEGSEFGSDDDLEVSGSHYGDDESRYSDHELFEEQANDDEAAEEVMTPRAHTPVQMAILNEGLPDPVSVLVPAPVSPSSVSSTDTNANETPNTQNAVEMAEETKPATTGHQADIPQPSTPGRPMSKPEYDGTGWGESDEEYDEEPGSPESVIHHPITEDEDSESERELPTIPEQLATIKASGSKLKTRVSNTPSDITAMREARRQVSGEVSSIPPIPERRRSRISKDVTAEMDISHDDFLARHPSFKNRSLTLDLEMGLSLDQDFERVIETQKVAFAHSSLQSTHTTQHTPSRQVSKQPPPPETQVTELDANEIDANITSRSQRGYLMRQNTKLVSASDKDGDDTWRARFANNSPVKKDRPQSWTVEPWNGQTRQRSVRRQPGMGGPVPPLPGQESNATALHRVVEEDYSTDAAAPDVGERGRLFVKVMGVKDLDLPIPKNERSWFSLTLDNGVHCVTTAWLELARNAPIGQEFELVVPNDLEFQLTLNVKLEKPSYTNVPASTVKMSKPKTSTFSRVFASPKKRKELELRQKAEEERFAQQQKEALARQRKDAGSAYELLSPLAAEDGSFARAYVCLKEHETRCFGRPYMVDVACFNEWATEEESFACSVKSKRGSTGVVRRAPYKVGKLELQLFFVPRPKNVTDDDMPKSMNSCIRELKAAEERLARNWEGHLSQQGGDCPYWRRRYFKLVGTKLTAYHEATRQPRATINLSNAKRLIDDRRTLTEKETTGKGGKRRRSAFAEEEEGYMFVEEGFRIRFNNGEVIDFYADTAEDKEGWMKLLSDVIGRGDSSLDEDGNGPRSRAKWCELVFKREEQLRRRADSRRVHSRSKSMYT